MNENWLISPALAASLPRGALDQLADIDPSSALTCQVCGKVKRRGDTSPMAVIAAEATTGTIVIGLAHPACRDLVGDRWPGLLEHVGTDEGLDALASFAIRARPTPRAVLAYEPQAFARLVPSGGDAGDLYVQGMLTLGLTLVRSPVMDLTPPPAPGWSLTGGAGVLTLSHTFGGVGYVQSLTPEVERWFRLAQDEGSCLVVTGTGLGIDPSRPVPADFAWARSRGLLVAGTVSVH